MLLRRGLSTNAVPATARRTTSHIRRPLASNRVATAPALAAASAAVGVREWPTNSSVDETCRALEAAANSAAEQRYIALSGVSYANARQLYTSVVQHLTRTASATPAPAGTGSPFDAYRSQIARTHQLTSRFVVPISSASGNASLAGTPPLTLPAGLYDSLAAAIASARVSVDSPPTASAAPATAADPRVGKQRHGVVHKLVSGSHRLVSLIADLSPFVSPLRIGPSNQPFLPLRTLLGVSSWLEWYKRGVKYPVLKFPLHPLYGVYFPPPPTAASAGSAQHVLLWEQFLSSSQWMRDRVTAIERERLRAANRADAARHASDAVAAVEADDSAGVYRRRAYAAPTAQPDSAADEDSADGAADGSSPLTRREQRRINKREDAIARAVRGLTVVDVGTGCGVLSLCLFKRERFIAHSIATDTSPLAVSGYRAELDRWCDAYVRDAVRVQRLTGQRKPITASVDAALQTIRSRFHVLPTPDLLVGVNRLLRELNTSTAAVVDAPATAITPTPARELADLIVFNPPWLPLRSNDEPQPATDDAAASALHNSMFRSPDKPATATQRGSMMARFFHQSYQQLHDDGRLCVVYSNLASLVGRETERANPIELELSTGGRFALQKRWELPVATPASTSRAGRDDTASDVWWRSIRSRQRVWLYELRKLPHVQHKRSTRSATAPSGGGGGNKPARDTTRAATATAWPLAT